MNKIPKIILSIETSRQVGRELLMGIADYANINGPWCFYSEPGDKKVSLPQTKDFSADGMIASINSAKKALKLREYDIPIITKDFKIEGIPVIEGDNESISNLAANHFFKMGLKYFAYCGCNRFEWSKKRGNFFKQFFVENNLEKYFYEKTIAFKQTLDKEFQELSTWLRSLPKPVGILAENDERGRHIIEACKISGIIVPDEVSVLGVDNDELICNLCEPQLSSIALATRKTGFDTAKLLDQMMSKKQKILDTKITVAPMHVIQRQSTNIIAVKDDDIIKAINFIRNNCRTPLTVTEVAETVNLSRRVLEKKFRKYLKRSVLEYIKSTRIDLISKMLIETDMTITEIAHTMGFPGVDHISRYFRQAKGINPRKFRAMKKQNK